MSYSDYNYKYNIDEDNTDVEKAVDAAKQKDWDTVFKILTRKPYLINCIPEGKAWAVLHQAVFWEDSVAVSRLLSFPNCDVFVRTKICRLQDAEHTSTPVEVAKQLGGRKDIIAMLEKAETNWSKRFSDKIQYQVVAKEGQELMTVEEVPLFIMAVVNYKNALLDPGTCPKARLLDMLNQIMKEEDHNWEKVQQKIWLSLYGVDKRAADEFQQSSSEKEYFKNIIHFYTLESDQHYTKINDAVSRDFNRKEPMRGQDLAIALYDLMLDCVLMTWEDLHVVDSTTFRGVPAVIDVQKGDQIMFTRFLSSSLKENTAKHFVGGNGTLLIIDNQAKTIHRPRNIKDHSKFPWEEECLYGIGAQFKVKNIDDSKSYKEIQLELLSDVKPEGGE